MYNDYLSKAQVLLSRADLRQMISLVRTLYALGNCPDYQRLIEEDCPAVARFAPGHDSVMMGYDFHLGPDGPRLIEVNTNAGGGLLAHLTHFPAPNLEALDPDHRLLRRIRDTFAKEWTRFCSSQPRALRGLAIVDETPDNQFLGLEMKAFARLLAPLAQQVVVIDPSELRAQGSQLYFEELPIDMIYNRHCDFYLDNAAMQPIRKAYLEGSLCLSPNPRSYALLGDKQRLCLFSSEEALAGLFIPKDQIDLLTRLVPRTRRLDQVDRDECWKKKKKLVFKPSTQFGSLGVFIGAKLTRGRFDEMIPEETLVQEYIAPSRVSLENEQEMKVDLRLFVYRDQVLGITARLYRGQVTNMRTEGGGFARVRLV